VAFDMRMFVLTGASRSLSHADFFSIASIATSGGGFGGCGRHAVALGVLWWGGEGQGINMFRHICLPGVGVLVGEGGALPLAKQQVSC
jgi:hypothetical protein